MQIVFRTDSSHEMGTGHVMRCLTMAHTLRQYGALVSFVCRDLYQNVSSIIRDFGFTVHMLPAPQIDTESKGSTDIYRAWLGVDIMHDARQTAEILSNLPLVDWLIVDHYALDYHWEHQLRKTVKGILAIDDLANRVHDVDILLDQNLYPQMQERYSGLVPPWTKMLLGPQYALLRPEFYRQKEKKRKRDGSIRRILIFFGGVDVTNETEKALDALEMLSVSIKADVVVGSANEHKDRIQEICLEHKNLSFHCNVRNMAELMADADLAIGAGGTTTWERCFLGLPSLIVILAENQVEVTNSVVRAGAANCLGWYSEVTSRMLASVLQDALNSPDMIREMAVCAEKIMGQESGVEKVCSMLLGGFHGPHS